MMAIVGLAGADTRIAAPGLDGQLPSRHDEEVYPLPVRRIRETEYPHMNRGQWLQGCLLEGTKVNEQQASISTTVALPSMLDPSSTASPAVCPPTYMATRTAPTLPRSSQAMWWTASGRRH